MQLKHGDLPAHAKASRHTSFPPLSLFPLSPGLSELNRRLERMHLH